MKPFDPVVKPVVPGGRRPPAPVWVAAGLLVLVAAVALILGILEIFSIRPHRAVVGVGAAILLIAYAVALGFIAWGLLRLRGWSRGPAAATQVVQLPVAYSFLNGPTLPIGVALALLSLTAIVCLVLPVSTRALVPHLLSRDD